MSALTANRNTPSVAAYQMFGRVRTIATGSTVYLGSIVAQNSDGKAVPASDTAGLVVLGRAERIWPDGSKVETRSGCFKFANGADAEAFTAADLNKVAYVVDDQTVGKVGGTNKIKAGTFRELDADGGVWVELANLRLT